MHISALSDTFVKDPREVVKAGDIVKVKVMAVDVDRQRIGLSMRLSDDATEESDNRGQSRQGARPGRANQVQGQHSKNRQNNGQSRRPEKNRSNGKASQSSGSDQPSALALSLKAALEGKS